MEQAVRIGPLGLPAGADSALAGSGLDSVPVPEPVAPCYPAGSGRCQQAPPLRWSRSPALPFLSAPHPAFREEKEEKTQEVPRKKPKENKEKRFVDLGLEPSARPAGSTRLG